MTYMLKVVLLFIALAYDARGACKEWLSREAGVALCVPPAWYWRTTPAGYLFLCSSPRGRCVTPVGGEPLGGHVTVSVRGLDRNYLGDLTKLSDVAILVAQYEGIADVPAIEEVRGRASSVHFAAFEKTDFEVAKNEVPRKVLLHVALIGNRFVLFRSTYNSDDQAPRVLMYRKAIMEMLRSLRPYP